MKGKVKDALTKRGSSPSKAGSARTCCELASLTTHELGISQKESPIRKGESGSALRGLF